MMVYNRKKEREEMELEKIAHNNRKTSKANFQTKTGSRLRKQAVDTNRTRISKSATGNSLQFFKNKNNNACYMPKFLFVCTYFSYIKC